MILCDIKDYLNHYIKSIGNETQNQQKVEIAPFGDQPSKFFKSNRHFSKVKYLTVTETSSSCL